MKLALAALTLAGCALAAQTPQQTANSDELLFAKSDSAAALEQSAQELAGNPHNLNARFVRMEAARIQLRTGEQLDSAIAILRKIPGQDPRARIAAERIRELAANTPSFRTAVPQIAELLREKNPYSRELSDAMLIAAADGVPLPRHLRLAQRITSWQVAGPFGEFSNVDFDRSGPPERDQLHSERYGQRVREDIKIESGKLELPDYFPNRGVYYAAAELSVAKSGRFNLTIESDGTFVMLIDGKPFLEHDARFRQQQTISHLEASLAAGSHRVLVKLQASSLPLRIWVEPSRESHAEALRISDAEQRYLRTATALLDGELKPALAFDDHSSSVEQLLRADALSQAGEEPEAREMLEAAAVSDPNDLLADFQMAQQAFANQRYEEAATRLGEVLKTSAVYAPAQELKYLLANHFDWPSERQEALAERLRLHPSCGALLDAANSEDSRGDSKKALEYETRLATCSSTPILFWDRLSHHGRHQQALTSIASYLLTHSGDRRALTAAIRETVLAGDKLSARRYAGLLRSLAPNSIWAESLARRPEMILDSRLPRSEAGDFYKPYIRDPLRMMSDSGNQSADNRVLINDRAVKLDSDGGAWIYQHTVTQVFDKKGIEQAGEVELPRSVDLLELRTLKRDGTFEEPEPNDNKGSVSMPALAEGDAVEVSYLEHFAPEVLSASPDLLDFAFSSTEFPTRSARLSLIHEGSAEPLFWCSPQVKRNRDEHPAFANITTWELSNAAATSREPAEARYDSRPRLLWLGMNNRESTNIDDRYPDELIKASQITPRIEQLAASLRTSAGQDPIAEAYRYVMSSVENEPTRWHAGNMTSADESFAQGIGSRAAALIALLAAMDFDVDLVLAADRGSQNPAENCSGSRCCTHPLVRVVLPDRETQLLLDPQLDGLAAGALSPEVEGEPAIVISRKHSSPVAEAVSIPQRTDQRSTATADLQLDESGSLQGTIHVRFGSLRGAQMRESLRQLTASDRQGYFEEIAGRILPGAGEVSGSLLHEDDPEQPLELELTAKVSKFARWNGTELQLGQVAPALGLSRMYATLPERREDLLLETPLIEDSEFSVHLPPGVEPSQLPEPVNLKSVFGDYRTEFKVENGVLRIVRSFQIPMQVVSQSEYAAFSQFAIQIDAAERALIQLRRTSSAHEIANSAIPAPVH